MYIKAVLCRFCDGSGIVDNAHVHNCKLSKFAWFDVCIINLNIFRSHSQEIKEIFTGSIAYGTAILSAPFPTS